MDGAVTGVEFPFDGLGGHDRLWLAGVYRRACRGITADVMIAAADRPTSLVVVIVATEHQVDAIAIKQG